MLSGCSLAQPEAYAFPSARNLSRRCAHVVQRHGHRQLHLWPGVRSGLRLRLGHLGLYLPPHFVCAWPKLPWYDGHSNEECSCVAVVVSWARRSLEGIRRRGTRHWLITRPCLRSRRAR